MEAKIIALLEGAGGPIRTAQVTQHLDEDKRDVNRSLYALESSGQISRVNVSPPKWTLRRRAEEQKRGNARQHDHTVHSLGFKREEIKNNLDDRPRDYDVADQKIPTVSPPDVSPLLGSAPRVRPCVLRSYQARIVDTIVNHNTIVVLPTGTGKTLIAAECAKRLAGPMVFFVPACILVQQQAAEIRDWTGLLVAEFMGRHQLPSEAFDVLVSTPKAFEMAQAKGAAPFQWHNFNIVCFDEVHHVLKDHPYRVLAKKLSASTAKLRVFGLSASLTYAVGQKKVEVAIQRLCDDLNITKTESSTTEELRAGGYHGGDIEVKVNPFVVPAVLLDGLLPEGQRKPHEMLGLFRTRIRDRTATPYSLALMACVRDLEQVVQGENKSFQSPLDRKSIREWGAIAHKLPGRGKLLEPWYEALRLLVVSWEEAQDSATVFLHMTGVVDQQWPSSLSGQNAHTHFLHLHLFAAPLSLLPRFAHLKEALLHQHESLLSAQKSLRCIIFVQQRVITHVLQSFIENDDELKPLFKTVCLYASSSPATASLRLSKREALDRINTFAKGEANLLISTDVAEEGMDVPEANCVIRFDPVIHSVSYQQGKGRARQEGSSLVVLAERKDRPVDVLRKNEAAQMATVRNMQPGSPEGGQERLLQAQRSRELNARDQLDFSKLPLKSQETYRQRLHLYKTKTKADLDQSKTMLVYKSVLRTERVPIPSPGSKQHQEQAAHQLLQLLEQASRS